MREINGIYTQGFNRSHTRTGHIFQGRYKSLLIDEDSYLLEVSRYIVLNPVKAKICKGAAEYRWSSYRQVMGQATSPDWLATDEVLKLFSSDKGRAIKEEGVRSCILTLGRLAYSHGSASTD